MRLSVLDLSPVPSGSSAAQALRNTIDLAQHAEALGFHRYWLAEHHNAAGLACSSPDVMIASVAAATKTIRVGSGGVMLPNHSPLKVAETFRALAALHPDRIDLGVGRAAGTDPKTALALRQAKELLGAEAFPAQLAELLHFLEHEPDPSERFGAMKATPSGVTPPPVFLLGSGMESAALAAKLGLGFAYAHHIGPDAYVEALRRYRASCARPYAILATGAITSATDADAQDHARCASLAWLRFGQGLRDLPFPSVEEARAYVFDADEEALRGRPLAGEARRVADTLRTMIERSEPDELMITTMIHDHAERVRSYERIARELAPRSS